VSRWCHDPRLPSRLAGTIDLMRVLETTQTAPLTLWEDGSIRIGSSRVTLDSVVHEFIQGSTAEQIQDDFPSLSLREIYGAISYYLEHEDRISKYLRRREDEAQKVRAEVEDRARGATLRRCVRERYGQFRTKPMAAFIPARGETIQSTESVRVLFIAGFGPIDRDVAESRKLYSEGLGVAFKEESGGYLHTDALQGVKHFALWPLSQAAESCFGKDSWPTTMPVPQAWLEFEVDSVEEATAKLESRGYQMIIKNKKEPWGQTVSRFLSSEGLLVGLTFTPSMREQR
jgi:uncharacterized protein (DUF433 family)